MTGMALLAALGGAMLAKDLAMGGLQIGTEWSLGKKRVGLDKMLAQAQIEAAKIANEENRRAAERYLAMFRETQMREQGERGQERQMELIMAMLQGLGGVQRTASQAFVETNRPMPPMALTTLMRG